MDFFNQEFVDPTNETDKENAEDFFDQESMFDSEESSDEVQLNEEELRLMAENFESQWDELKETAADSKKKIENMEESCEPFFEELEKGRELPKVPKKQFQKWFQDFAPNKDMWNKVRKFKMKRQKNQDESAGEEKNCGGMRSPTKSEIEEDTTIYSVISEPELRGFWDDFKDRKADPSAKSMEEEACRINEATESLLSSLEKDFPKRKRCWEDEDGSDLWHLPSSKRLKAISERLGMEGLVLDSEDEKPRVLEDLMKNLAHRGFHRTPEGRFLLRELRENQYQVKYTDVALEPDAERTIRYLVDSDRIRRMPNGQFTQCEPRESSLQASRRESALSEAERRWTARQLMSSLGSHEFRESPVGQFLLRVLCENNQVRNAGVPYLEKLPGHRRPEGALGCFDDHFLNCENVKLLKDDWTKEIIWDEKDLRRIRKKPVTIDRTLFSHLNHEVYKVDPDLEEVENLQLNLDTEYYEEVPRSLVMAEGFQHSIPVQEYSQVLFPPIFSNEQQLRAFHRTRLRFRGGSSGLERVYPLSVHMEFVNKMRKKEEASFPQSSQMRTLRDLTGKDGDLVLMEFSEDHPPLMNEVGMASKMYSYYVEGSEAGLPEPKFGRAVGVPRDQRLFFGAMKPGRYLNAVENNMYRAPIFEHNMRKTDFLVIYSEESFYIREINGLYAVGQQCPLMEVPRPYCKKAHDIVRDYVEHYICRQFWKSTDNPKSLRMDELRSAFRSQSEVYLRRRLSLWSEFSRSGNENKWVVRRGIILPQESELRSALAPELYCAYKSMKCAELRLREEGYQIKVRENEDSASDDEDEGGEETEDALKAAPWSTTNAYVMAANKKCLLDAYTSTDPTDCGVGYSYVKVHFKPPTQKESNEDSAKMSASAVKIKEGSIKASDSLKKIATTGKDFRKLTYNESKIVLRQLGVPNEEIDKLTRFQIVKRIRELSNELASSGVKNLRFARQTVSVLSDHKKKYMDRCQQAFDIQNRYLETKEFSSDEEESEDDEIKEMSKKLELEFLKMMEKGKERKSKTEEKKVQKDPQPKKPQKTITKLKITRAFQDRNGMPVLREEILTDPELIRCYLKERERLGQNKSSSKVVNKEMNKVKKPNRNPSEIPPEERERIRREKKRVRDRNRYRKQKENRQNEQAMRVINKNGGSGWRH